MNNVSVTPIAVLPDSFPRWANAAHHRHFADQLPATLPPYACTGLPMEPTG